MPGRWLLTRAVPVRGPDAAVARWFGVSADIDSQMREEEALEERVAARTRELNAAHERLRTLSRRVVGVQEEERRAVARELHDSAGQGLTAVTLQLRLLEAECQGAGGAERIAAMRRTLDEVMTGLHDLSARLRPAALERLGLERALAQLCGATRLAGVEAECSVEIGPPEVPPEIEATAFRVVQEALTNVVRHAAAGLVRVTIGRRGGSLDVLVADDGRGFDVAASRASGRLGLAGMAERVELLGGTLEIESDESGSRVRAVLPLPEAAG